MREFSLIRSSEYLLVSSYQTQRLRVTFTVQDIGADFETLHFIMLRTGNGDLNIRKMQCKKVLLLAILSE